MIPRLGGVSAPWTTYDSYSRNAFGRLGNEGLERSSRTDGRGPQDGSDTAQNVMERASIRHSTTPERSPRSCSQKAVREHDFLHWIGSDWDTAASSPTYSSPSFPSPYTKAGGGPDRESSDREGVRTGGVRTGRGSGPGGVRTKGGSGLEGSPDRGGCGPRRNPDREGVQTGRVRTRRSPDRAGARTARGSGP